MAVYHNATHRHSVQFHGFAVLGFLDMCVGTALDLPGSTQHTGHAVVQATCQHKIAHIHTRVVISFWVTLTPTCNLKSLSNQGIRTVQYHALAEVDGLKSRPPSETVSLEQDVLHS